MMQSCLINDRVRNGHLEVIAVSNEKAGQLLLKTGFFEINFFPVLALALVALVSIIQPGFGYCQESNEPVSILDEVPKSDLNPANASYNAVRILVEDGLYIYSSPARMSSNDALKLGAYLAATGLLYIFDQEILDMIQRSEDSALLHPLWEIGDFLEPVGHMGNTNAFYVGGMVVGYFAGLDKFSLVCGQLLESHYIAGFAKNLANDIVGRERPYADEGPTSFFNEDATSFPSGHASNIFQVATILSYHVDRKPFTWAAYGCASLVGIQRVRSDMHWASDVFLSAVYGTAVARAVLKLHEERSVTVTPHFSALGVGMQLGWRF